MISNGKHEKTALALLFALCLGLRLFLLTQKNLWFDEVYSWHMTLGGFWDILTVTSGDIHPPLYYFFLKLWVLVFGDSVLALRLPSCLFGSLAIFPIYGLSREILSRRESVAVLVLYALSPLNLYFSQEARMYALNLFLTAGSTYLLLEAFKTRHQARKGAIFAGAFAIVSAASLYTHYYSVLVYAAQAAFIVMNRDSLDRRSRMVFFASFASAIALFAPWLPVILNQVSAGQAWRQNPDVVQALAQPVIFMGDTAVGWFGKYAAGDYFIFFQVAAALALTPGLAAVVSYLRRSWKERDGIPLFLFLLVILPFSVSNAVAFFRSVDIPRYLSIAVPYVLILVVFSLRFMKRPLGRAILATFLLLNLAGLGLYFGANHKLNDYRGVLDALEGENGTREPLYVYPHYYGWILDYYGRRGSYRGRPRENYGWTIDMLERKIQKDRPEAFWLVLDEHAEDSGRYREYLERLPGPYRVEERRFFPSLPDNVGLYKLKRLSPGIARSGPLPF